mgnify:CR=1 FL=1
MKPYGAKSSFKKKGSYQSKNKLSLYKLRFLHKIFNSINFSSLLLIFILYFLSFNSQREWSATYKSLSIIKENNNNLIDYISQTEEFYIDELESLKTFKKTTPKDLIYLEKATYQKDNYLNKKLENIINGIKDSKYQIGY